MVRAAVFLSVVLGGCSLLDHPWRKADEYVAGLRCNMSEVELRTYSEQYARVEIWDHGKPEFMVARRGNTQVRMWLGADGLIAYQISWSYPLTNVDSQLKTDLCTGARYVDLDLVGDSELSGAAVWLDHERVGELSETGTFSIDVPLGKHELRIEKPGSGSWGTELSYDESSAGYDRLPVPDDAFRSSSSGPPGQ